jgi:hypothetical protein
MILLTSLSWSGLTFPGGAEYTFRVSVRDPYGNNTEAVSYLGTDKIS